MSTNGFNSDFDTLADDDGELLAGLHRSVAGATMTTSAADVVALGRRTRNRHRAVAAGIGTSAAAIVAAIGVLAPAAGHGPAGVPDAAGQKAVGTPAGTTATTSASAQLVNIQDAGFSLAEHADGTVTVSLSDAFDPGRLEAALTSVGIPSAILVRPVPEGWDLNRGIECTPDPGVHIATGPDQALLKATSYGASPTITITKSKIPAGDFITLTRFEKNGRIEAGSFGVDTGKQTTCVPEYPVARPKPVK